MNIKSLLLGLRCCSRSSLRAQLPTQSSLPSRSPWNTFASATLSARATSTSRHGTWPQDQRLHPRSGLVRRDEVTSRDDNGGTSDWDMFSRAYIAFDAKSDTEYGTLTGFLRW